MRDGNYGDQLANYQAMEPASMRAPNVRSNNFRSLMD
ncbi:hypothetical protein ACVWY5_003516 [Bradyrhizobium sp. USDA 3256]